MTPHELNLHIIEFGERSRRDSENDIVAAYLTAYWQKVKRMPSLKQILKDMKPKRKQTDEQMLAVVKQLNSMFGGTERVE